MLPHRDGARLPPDVTLGIQAKEFIDLGFIIPENLVSHGFESPLGDFLANSKWAAMCLLLSSGFRLATLPLRPDWWNAAEVVVLLEDSPISTEELRSSVTLNQPP